LVPLDEVEITFKVPPDNVAKPPTISVSVAFATVLLPILKVPADCVKVVPTVKLPACVPAVVALLTATIPAVAIENELAVPKRAQPVPPVQLLTFNVPVDVNDTAPVTLTLALDVPPELAFTLKVPVPECVKVPAILINAFAVPVVILHTLSVVPLKIKLPATVHVDVAAAVIKLEVPELDTVRLP
jgi:hypothetical protein